MKSLSFALFTLALFASTSAKADEWSRRPGHPGWGRACIVSFKKCDFNVNGFCVKWNNKSFRVSYREARWACQRAQQEYGYIKNCRVQCN